MRLACFVRVDGRRWDYGIVPPRQSIKPSPSDMPHAGSSSGSTEEFVQASWMKLPLWLWPAVAIGLIAIAGYIFGPFGALLTATEAVGMALYVAVTHIRDTGRRTIATALSIAVCTALILGGLALVRTARSSEARQLPKLNVPNSRYTAVDRTGMDAPHQS